MSKPPVNEQGVPVRRGAYDYETKRGKLQDVNQDNQVSFADTWIGDMLGMDGQGGVQGPSMRDSMGGARRRAIEMMQEQGVPMTQANLARAMERPGGAGAPSDLAQPGTVMHEDQPITATPLDEGGGAGGPLAAAATGVVAGAYAAKKLLGGKPLQPDAQGRVLAPTDGAGGVRMISMTPQEAADMGWAVVGLNYPDGGNTLPAPGRTPAIDVIDGTAEDVTDVSRSAAGPAGGGANAGTAAGASPDPRNAGPVAGDAATRPISTEELMEKGVGSGTEVGTAGGDNTRFVQQSVFSHDGMPIFADNVDGGFVTRRPDGSVVTAPTMEALKAAVRAAIR